MKLKSLFVTLGLSLALGTSALLPAFSASKETKVAHAAYSYDGLTKITAENSSSFVGSTAYVIGSNTTYGLTASGSFGTSGDLLALTIESANGSSLVLKRNDNNKYLNNPCNGSWSDSSVTRYINSNNSGLSWDTDAYHYWWAVKFPGGPVYYENHYEDSSGTQQSIFYVYAEPAEPTVLSLKVNDGWTADSARFAAYFFGKGEETTWVDMTLVSGSSRLYEVTAPDGFTGVIFCRMDGSKPENNWANKWEQTRDLTVADGDYFLMDESGVGGDWYTGSDAVYAPCDVSEWTESETNKLTWNRLSGQYEIKAFAGLPKDANFKVHDSTNNAWAGFKGEGMTNDYTLFSGAEGSDITCLASTVYDIYYKPFANSIWIEENQTIAADHFAQAFLDTTDGICVDSSQSAGDTDLDALKAVWNAKESPDGSSLVEKWNALSIGAKGTFAEGTATENITNAYARYVHIMSRYSDALTPFSGGPAYSASSQFALNSVLSNNSVSIILVITSVTLVALCAMVVLKKRKAN